MKKPFVLATLLALAACAPLEFRRTDDALTAAETETGDVAVTPEPFVDPLAPTSFSGSTAAQEHALDDGTLVLGRVNARATMTLFLNLESPYSVEFVRTRLPIVMEEFVETGLLKVRVHILPIAKYDHSESSARYLACATEFGKGYPALVRMAEKEFPGLDIADIADFGLDSSAFTTCNTDGRDVQRAANDAAARYGVTLVPSYVLDGETFVGLPTEADLRGQVRAAL